MLQTVGDEEYVKLIDFGLATVQELTSKAINKTTQVAGTPAYMAPEQFQGKPVIASDIYALGVIAYEMVTGRKPFNAESSYEMVEMQRSGVRVLPCDLRPGLPAAAQAVILKALSFAPAERYASAKSFADAFAHALTLEQPKKQPSAPQPKKRGLLLAALVVILALGTVAVWRWINNQKPGVTTQSLAAPERRLQYWLTVERDRKRYPNSQPFTLPDGNYIFGAGDRVRLHLSSPQTGFLYLLNEGPKRDKELPQFIVLFPEAITNRGSAEVGAHQAIQIPPPGARPERAWFEFDQEDGEEKRWLHFLGQMAKS